MTRGGHLHRRNGLVLRLNRTSLTIRAAVRMNSNNSFTPALTPSRSFWSLEAEVSNATPRRRVERAMTLNNGRPLDQFSSQRSCGAPGCTARLSRYNPNATCAAHGG